MDTRVAGAKLRDCDDQACRLLSHYRSRPKQETDDAKEKKEKPVRWAVVAARLPPKHAALGLTANLPRQVINAAAQVN
jgi:hypothetical protein